MATRLLIVSFSVCPGPDRQGVGLQNLIKALASRYSVDVLTLRSGELPFVERFMKTRMLRVPVGAGTLTEQAQAFRRAIRRQLEGEEYDLVHLRSAWGGRAVIAGGPSKLVYEVARSTEGEPRAADAKLAARLADEERACVERADLVLVPTETARAHLLGQGKKRAGQLVEVVPPGVDVDHFDWEPAPEAEPERPRILYAGRLSAGRGIRLLARALGVVRRTRRFQLVLAGPVEESFRPLLDQALAQAGLGGDDVEQLGPIDHDDMPRVIAQAAVCVAPASPDESRPLAGFPTKVLEYMACRRAVVAPRRPSVEEVVRADQDGVLFAPDDSDDLARALGRLLDDRALRDRCAQSGYERVRAAHPASATRRRLLAAYARLVPQSAWAPLARAEPPIDPLPPHPETTTALHAQLAAKPARGEPVARPPGRAAGEASGEIEIVQPQSEPEVRPGEIVIEALDFVEAGEPLEPHFADGARTPAASAGDRAQAVPALDTEEDPFGEELRTRPYGFTIRPKGSAAAPAPTKDPDADGEEEKTRPVALRPRGRSE